jgi:hypothetical protein
VIGNNSSKGDTSGNATTTTGSSDTKDSGATTNTKMVAMATKNTTVETGELG